MQSLIGYLYDDKIYIKLTPEFDAVDQITIEKIPKKDLVLEKFFSKEGQYSEIKLTLDDYKACRLELSKIDINRAKESIKELEGISNNIKKFVIDNFDISDLFWHFNTL